jgi:hypothetical protein
MLKQKRSLLWEFAACIFAVFVAFLVFPLLLRASWCEPTLKNQWGIYGNNYASQQQYASNSVPDTVVIHQQQAANQNSNSNKIYSEYLGRTGFCEDTKFTDWALVFFTGCLVIVGWFTMRSGQRETRAMERPYIFATPRIDVEASAGGNIKIKIMLQNYGRTPGDITGIYGEISLTEPIGMKSIYENGSLRPNCGSVGPTLGKPVRAPVTFESPYPKPQYFFGYMTYEDIFREKHTSRYCVQVFLGSIGIEAAGTDAWNDWN